MIERLDRRLAREAVELALGARLEALHVPGLVSRVGPAWLSASRACWSRRSAIRCPMPASSAATSLTKVRAASRSPCTETAGAGEVRAPAVGAAAVVGQTRGALHGAAAQTRQSRHGRLVEPAALR